MKSKHLTLNDRIKISQMLSEQKSFKAIAAAIEKIVLLFQEKSETIWCSEKPAVMDGFTMPASTGEPVQSATSVRIAP